MSVYNIVRTLCILALVEGILAFDLHVNKATYGRKFFFSLKGHLQWIQAMSSQSNMKMLLINSTLNY